MLPERSWPWLLAPSPARAGSFLDADAGLFTLVRPDDRLDVRGTEGLGRLRALPDGGALFVVIRTGRLWRLHADGRLESLKWAGSVGPVAVERGGSVLVVRYGSTRLERLFLADRRRATVVDLARAPGFRRRDVRGPLALAALDDGVIAASARTRVWRITPSRAISAIPNEKDVDAMVALPAGAFGILSAGGDLSRVERDGTIHPLASGVAAPISATADGRIVATADQTAPALTAFDAGGVATRYARDASEVLGAGEGLPLRTMRWAGINSMAVAADGSLLLATRGNRIRAVVPADSLRARVAITQATFGSFSEGRVGFRAGAPGRWELEVRRAGRMVQRAAGSASAGDGELAISAPAPGAYDLRLRLRTTAAVTESRMHVDLRDRLPVREGQAAIQTQRTSSEGDDGGGAGSEVGRCGRVAALVVECALLAVEFGSNFDDPRFAASGTSVPFALARGVLRRDGAVETEVRPVAPTHQAPKLGLTVPERLRLGAGRELAARIATPDGGHATVSAVVTASGARMGVVVPEEALELAAGAKRRVGLRLSERGARQVRRWLAKGHKVEVDFIAKLSVDAGIAPAVATRVLRSDIVR